MRDQGIVFILVLLLAGSVSTQTKPGTEPSRIPSAVPIKPGTAVLEKSPIDKGSVDGRTYTNKDFGFQVTFPDTWLIPGDDFEDEMKKQGFNLGLKAPDSLPPASKATIDRALKRVNILLTAYRSMPGMTDNAIVRISIENLSTNPQIKDAVDYFDAIRAMYRTMRLPADFKYSETQAERLGKMQFGYIDTSSSAGKKRMYATVRNGFAVMFTISYTRDDDLNALRDMLANGNFGFK
jgi:hypothetical protein